MRRAMTDTFHSLERQRQDIGQQWREMTLGRSLLQPGATRCIMPPGQQRHFIISSARVRIGRMRGSSPVTLRCAALH